MKVIRGAPIDIKGKDLSKEVLRISELCSERARAFYTAAKKHQSGPHDRTPKKKKSAEATGQDVMTSFGRSHPAPGPFGALGLTLVSPPEQPTDGSANCSIVVGLRQMARNLEQHAALLAFAAKYYQAERVYRLYPPELMALLTLPHEDVDLEILP